MSFDKSNFLPSNMLDCLEQFWGFGLPKDYREYLSTCNGETPTKTVMHLKNERQGRALLRGLFGIRRGHENLLVKSQFMGDRCLDTMLPIGYDSCGNLVLLTVKGKDRNKVFFWDHEMESDDDEAPSYDNLTLIADSFTEFMESLYDDEEEA